MASKTSSASTGAVTGAVQGLISDSLDGFQRRESPIKTLLQQHFGADPRTLPVDDEPYPFFLLVALQRAVDRFISEPGREVRILGVTCPSAHAWMDVKLGRLLEPSTLNWATPQIGPVGYGDLPCGHDEKLPVILEALFVINDAHGPAVLWLRPGTLEVMAPTKERVAEIHAEFRALARLDEFNPFLRQMVIMHSVGGKPFPIFIKRPDGTTEDELILPDGLRDIIDDHTIDVVQNQDRLMASKRHLKRGLLLYGRPGTGKTHTVRYLATKLPEHTFIILPGSKIGMATELAELVRMVEPAVVVIDDVDLIATDRELPSMASQAMLFDLLDVLDGAGDDADVTFILTTNRIDVLETAVAARPGRIDQAVEVPLPDARCRKRLFDLYARDVDLDVKDLDVIIARTEGVTAAFIKELVRRALIMAVQEVKKSVPVTDAHFTAALDEMLNPNNPLTKLLLGAEPDHAMPTVEVVHG